ncbi:hypothetical protein Sipo8835_31365 [Streptomyces ipomoeae]|jgi:hypothetical protein|uniref:Uncharacterized protein n=1 Tax=Streptomyces ipomoeae TaxID=103232 RepID=A0AAE9AY96_9ACTN|nr:hypothetical protein [Streptomyces ipomoeae]MDX2698517.1 hypothetical protein [Streptomyces ipomoeae]MDX2825131.1 hypothetical protein [Streptomyces ipomoeae]MDX2842530.1 hypothetical protein [Streptomyces ipomoeae]MDX2876925.1 hypothetical protein [Streptomyces ipomoeae]TQE25493.1 hypothetical protein Sipo8835_31365 [Streptomyces ipomoeae]
MTSPESQIQQARQQDRLQDQPEAMPQATLPEERHDQERHTGGKVVHLHTAHPRVPIPYVTPGDIFRTGTKATSLLPSPRKLAFYGLLGGMTAAGAMAWPVAVAVGAATEVITREQAARQHEEHERLERERTGREQARRSIGQEERMETGEPARTSMM